MASVHTLGEAASLIHRHGGQPEWNQEDMVRLGLPRDLTYKYVMSSRNGSGQLRENATFAYVDSVILARAPGKRADVLVRVEGGAWVVAIEEGQPRFDGVTADVVMSKIAPAIEKAEQKKAQEEADRSAHAALSTKNAEERRARLTPYVLRALEVDNG